MVKPKYYPNGKICFSVSQNTVVTVVKSAKENIIKSQKLKLNVRTNQKNCVTKNYLNRI